MHDNICIGFDFGLKRIGVAVGQRLTLSASPLKTLSAHAGKPDWNEVAALIKTWRPNVLVVGLPKAIDDTELYITQPSKDFAQALKKRFQLPVYLVDERLTTKEAKAYIYEHGGYQKLKKSEIDSIAACLILEQWLQYPDHYE